MVKRYIRRIRKTFPDIGPRTVAIGIDPSLSGTALAVAVPPMDIEWVHGWTDKKATQRRNPVKLSHYKIADAGSHADRIARIDLVASWVAKVVQEYVSSPGYRVHVALEGLAYSKRSSRASDLAELSGVIKRDLFRRGIPFRIYDPMSVKAAWTGSGTADKAAMVMACFRRFGLDYTTLETAGDNFADATLLALLLLTELGVRDGSLDLERDVDAKRARVLLRTTRAQPRPLIETPFVCADEVGSAAPILGGT